jgi:hypothetical protein
MTDQGATPLHAAELLTRIRAGMVARAMRLLAARGMLPVSREELIRLLVVLTVDGDGEIVEAARETLASFGTEHLIALLAAHDLDAVEIDLLARSRVDDQLWQAIVRQPRVANETLRWLARAAPPGTQDAIITNQTRLMTCLEALDDLRANKQVVPDVLRRVREFEDEFLKKATVWATADQLPEEVAEETGVTIEQALTELRELGMQIPALHIELPQLPEPERAAPKEIRDTFRRLLIMNVFQRIMRALKGSKEERRILVRDVNLLVVRAVLASPKLTEQDVEELAASRSLNVEALRIIAHNPRWTRRYPVVRALVFNPKTPIGIAGPLSVRLNLRDLGILNKDKNVAEGVRKMAKQFKERRG